MDTANVLITTASAFIVIICVIAAMLRLQKRHPLDKEAHAIKIRSREVPYFLYGFLLLLVSSTLLVKVVNSSFLILMVVSTILSSSATIIIMALTMKNYYFTTEGIKILRLWDKKIDTIALADITGGYYIHRPKQSFFKINYTNEGFSNELVFNELRLDKPQNFAPYFEENGIYFNSK